MTIERIRIAGAALVSLSLSSAAFAGQAAAPASEASVEQALVSHGYRGAFTEYNKLVTQRLPPNDTSGPDPVLDRLLAKLIAPIDPAGSGVALLQRMTSDPELPDRGHYQLLLGTALEDSGALGEAERTYRSLSTAPAASADDRIGATIGFARLRMMTSPDEALAALQAVQPAAAQMWEVELHRSRAEALAGREDAAQAARQRAWNAAPMAGAEQGAVARIASDMMLAAGRSGDRTHMIALLAVDRLNRSPNTGQDVLGGNLPLCGSAGIRPEDSVAIEFLRRPPPGRSRFALVWASRPGIAATFLAAVARNPGFQVSDGQAAAVTLRCRVGPAGDYRINANLGDQIMGWSTSRGAYPFRTIDEVDNPSALASALADRERRYGPTSHMLLPVLLQIQELMAPDAMNQETLISRAKLMRRMAAIIAASGGPADILLLKNLSATALEVVAQAKSATAAQAEFKTLLDAAVRSRDVSLDTLFAMVGQIIALPQVTDALRIHILEQTIAVVRARTTITDPRAMALGLQLLQIRSQQDDRAAVAALIERHGFASDLCSVATPAVRFGSLGITPDDYPADLIPTLLQGRTTIEFGIDPKGSAKDIRILISDPPYTFDEIAGAGGATIVYEPMKIEGAPRACTGQVRAISWQLPY